jgi:hypothetical protein
VETTSEAPFFRLGKRKEFVETEAYSVKFKFKNLGQTTFTKSNAWMLVTWTSGQIVSWHIEIPELKPEQEQYANFESGKIVEKSAALSSGYGLISCLKIGDWENVKLTSLDGHDVYGIGPQGFSVQSIKATSWDTIYTRYSVYLSLIALVIVAIEALPKLLAVLDLLASFIHTLPNPI